MRVVLPLIVLVLCSLVAPARGDPVGDRLLQIADEKNPQREAALAWWKALPLGSENRTAARRGPVLRGTCHELWRIGTIGPGARRRRKLALSLH